MHAESTLIEAARAIRRHECTSVQLVEAALERIEKTDDKIGAFAFVDADGALAAAAACDAGEIAGPLAGVPIAVKDLFNTQGVPTKANSQALAGFVPDSDADAVALLRRAGAVIIGKTNTHELAFGVSCPASRNPWDRGRMTGGSSGGSAAALAAGQVFGALGTDTGGSVRIPSSYCSTTGLKTTRGVISRRGVHLISPTYDTVGPMARTAADCRVLLDVLAPHAVLVDERPIESMTLGVPDESFWEGIAVDPQVHAIVDRAVDVLRPLVRQVRSVAVPHARDHADHGSTIVFAEAAELLTDLRERAGQLIGHEVFDILETGAAFSASQVAAARLIRTGFEQRYVEVFEGQHVDVIITPVTPNQVLPHGTTALNGMPLISATTPFTFAVNGAGLPAIALPGGVARDGLPIGFQLIGSAWSDRTLTAVGSAFQAVTDFHLARPMVLAY